MMDAEQIQAFQQLATEVPAASNVLTALAQLVEETWVVCQQSHQGRIVGMGEAPGCARFIPRKSGESIDIWAPERDARRCTCNVFTGSHPPFGAPLIVKG